MTIRSSTVDSVIDHFKQRQRRMAFADDPVAWAAYMLGDEEGTLWSKQRKIARAVVKHNSVAIKAGHGVGKSRLVAVLICWWVDTRYPNCFVVSTAPSTAQVKDVVWREVTSLKNVIDRRFEAGLIDHKLPGRITMDAKWTDDSTGVPLGRGRKPPDNMGGDSFQGIHGDVLAIGDEACGLTEELIDALGNITTNDVSRRVLIANPTNPASYLGTIFKRDLKNWHKETISVLDSPNFTGEKMPESALRKLTGPEYVEQKKKEFGEDSPRYKARILGEFAFDMESSLIQPEDIERACATEIEELEDFRPVIGVDVARFGSDRSVVYSCTNGRIRFVDSWGKHDLVESSARVDDIARRIGAAVVAVDCDGIGGGLFDILARDEKRDYDVLAIRGSAASPDRGRWHNYRSYMWDAFRQRCHDGDIDLDPLDTDLHDELLSVEYKYNVTSGGLVMMSKDDLKKEIGKSPDLADAAIYAAITDYDIEASRQQDTYYMDSSELSSDYYLEEMENSYGFSSFRW